MSTIYPRARVYLCAGGVPAVVGELLHAELLDESPLLVNNYSISRYISVATNVLLLIS